MKYKYRILLVDETIFHSPKTIHIDFRNYPPRKKRTTVPMQFSFIYANQSGMKNKSRNKNKIHQKLFDLYRYRSTNHAHHLIHTNTHTCKTLLFFFCCPNIHPLRLLVRSAAHPFV